jgi:hypothetical protein
MLTFSFSDTWYSTLVARDQSVTTICMHAYIMSIVTLFTDRYFRTQKEIQIFGTRDIYLVRLPDIL